MYTITNGKSKVTCNACKKETLTVENAGTRPRKTRQAVRAAGWLWLGRDVQLCPKDKGKAAQFAKEAKAEKASKPKTVASKVKLTPKKADSSKSNGEKATPIPGAQSIGKVARSAKVSAAPPAE
jgi:hypothetical protein